MKSLLLVDEFFSSGKLKIEGDKGSFYNPGGVPWQQRVLFLEAKSLLLWSTPSIGSGTAIGMEFPYGK